MYSHCQQNIVNISSPGSAFVLQYSGSPCHNITLEHHLCVDRSATHFDLQVPNYILYVICDMTLALDIVILDTSITSFSSVPRAVV